MRARFVAAIIGMAIAAEKVSNQMFLFGTFRALSLETDWK